VLPGDVEVIAIAEAVSYETGNPPFHVGFSSRGPEGELAAGIKWKEFTRGSETSPNAKAPGGPPAGIGQIN
jgi:hypothetical protein